jgi:hypothetical protein
LFNCVAARIACIKKTACFKSYRNKKKNANKEPREQQQQPKNAECRDRSSPAASDTAVVGPFPADAAEAQETAATAATGAIQVTQKRREKISGRRPDGGTQSSASRRPIDLTVFFSSATTRPSR